MITENEDAILKELKAIKKLLALSLVKNESSINEQVKMLDRCGFQQKEISDLLQLSYSNVRVILFRDRQTKKKKTIKKAR